MFDRGQVLKRGKQNWIMPLLCILLIGCLPGCQSAHTAECWAKMKAGYFELFEFQRVGQLSSAKSRHSREQLSSVAHSCDTEEVWQPLGGVVANRSGYITLLDVAVAANDPEMVARAISLGLTAVGAKSGQGLHLYGSTSLHLAALFESDAALAELIRAGTPVDLLDEGGYNALHFAGASTNAGLRNIRMLADAGIDVNAEGGHGLRPLDMASSRQDWRAVSCLRSLGATSARPDSRSLSSNLNDADKQAVAGFCDANADSN